MCDKQQKNCQKQRREDYPAQLISIIGSDIQNFTESSKIKIKNLDKGSFVGFGGVFFHGKPSVFITLADFREIEIKVRPVIIMFKNKIPIFDFQFFRRADFKYCRIKRKDEEREYEDDKNMIFELDHKMIIT